MDCYTRPRPPWPVVYTPSRQPQRNLVLRQFFLMRRRRAEMVRQPVGWLHASRRREEAARLLSTSQEHTDDTEYSHRFPGMNKSASDRPLPDIADLSDLAVVLAPMEA